MAMHITVSFFPAMFGLIFFVGGIHHDIDGVTLFWSNTTAILASPSHTLQIVQDVSYPGDWEHEIELFQVNSECADLPKVNHSFTQTGHDFVSINLTTEYALPGSSISILICGSTNFTVRQGRLDLVIVKGLEDLRFTESILKNYYSSAYFSPGEDGLWKCKNFILNIESHDYYTLVFLPLPPTSTAVFNYSVTYNILSVDISHTKIISRHTLYKDQDKWEFYLPWYKQYSTFCIIAIIWNTVHQSIRNLHIKVNYASASSIEAYKAGVSVVIASLSYFVIGTIIIAIIRCIIPAIRKKRVSFR